MPPTERKRAAQGTQPRPLPRSKAQPTTAITTPKTSQRPPSLASLRTSLAPKSRRVCCGSWNAGEREEAAQIGRTGARRGVVPRRMAETEIGTGSVTGTGMAGRRAGRDMRRRGTGERQVRRNPSVRFIRQAQIKLRMPGIQRRTKGESQPIPRSPTFLPGSRTRSSRNESSPRDNRERTVTARGGRVQPARVQVRASQRCIRGSVAKQDRHQIRKEGMTGSEQEKTGRQTNLIESVT